MKMKLFPIFLLFLGCAKQNNSTTKDPSATASADPDLSISIEQVNSVADETVVELDQTILGRFLIYKNLISQLNKLRYDSKFLSPAEAAKMLLDTRISVLALKDQFLNGLEKYRTLDDRPKPISNPQEDILNFNPESVCKNRSLPAFHKINGKTYLGSLDLKFQEESKCINLIKAPLNKIITTTKLARALNLDYSIGMLLIQALEDQIHSNLLPLKLSVIEGQQAPTTVYSTSTFLKTAFKYRLSFETSFYSQLIISNNKIEFPKEKNKILINSLDTIAITGEDFKSMIPTSEKTVHSIVDTQISQARALREYVESAFH